MKEKIPLIIVTLLGLLIFGGVSFMLVAPRERVAQNNGITLKYIHRKDDSALAAHLLVVEARGEEKISRVTAHYRISGEKELRELPMMPIDGSDSYMAFIPGQKIGAQVYLFFTAENEEGGKVTLPEKADEGRGLYGGMYRITWKGTVSRPLLWTHILLMIGALLCFLHGLYFALRNILIGREFRKCYGTFLAGTIIFFITGFPLGITAAKQAFGVGWGGIPFGWDITDNKTLIIFLYFAIIMIMGWKNFAHGEPRPVSDKIFSLCAVIGTVLTAILYLVPHSL